MLDACFFVGRCVCDVRTDTSPAALSNVRVLLRGNVGFQPDFFRAFKHLHDRCSIYNPRHSFGAIFCPLPPKRRPCGLSVGHGFYHCSHSLSATWALSSVGFCHELFSQAETAKVLHSTCSPALDNYELYPRCFSTLVETHRQASDHQYSAWKAADHYQPSDSRSH